jgi:hypothetical protein|tara:strand:- start:281 stop:424 length:144 start_codon:yes stop_codon:yes gene_type:complete
MLVGPQSLIDAMPLHVAGIVVPTNVAVAESVMVFPFGCSVPVSAGAG